MKRNNLHRLLVRNGLQTGDHATNLIILGSHIIPSLLVGNLRGESAQQGLLDRVV